MLIKAHTSYLGKTGYNAHARGFFRELQKYFPLFVRNFTVDNNLEEYINPIDKKILSEQTLFDNGKLKEFPMAWNPEILDKNNNEKIHIVLNETNHHYFYHNYIGKKIAFNVWESTRQPDDFFEQLKTFDQLWVPSEWQKKCSIEQGYPENKIYIIHEGIENDCELQNEVQNNDIFTFTIIGSWCFRKSTKELIELFLDVFKDIPTVKLNLIVDSPFLKDGLKSTAERLKYYHLDNPKIQIINFSSRKDYLLLLKQTNVFLSCSRAEGWNIPLSEALVCGIPSIFSDCGGQQEFTQNYPLKIPIIGEIPACHDFEKTDFPGNYYNPDFNKLKEIIWETYINYSTYKEQYIRLSPIIRKEFSWENVTQKAVKILNSSFGNGIKFHCSYLGTGGYNIVSRDLCRNLNKIFPIDVRNYTVCDKKDQYLLPIDSEILTEQTLWINDKERKDFPTSNKSVSQNNKINIIFNELEHFYFYENYNGQKIAFCLNETTKIPQTFANHLNSFDEVWVASEWQKLCFIDQGINVSKIFICPIGIDISSKFYKIEKNSTKPFNFLLVGRWDHRKSTKEIISCFNDVFKGADCILNLVVDNSVSIDKLNSTEERISHYNLASNNIKIHHWLPQDEYYNFIKSSHVLISCSRGEGWNYPLMEAMAIGIPTIYPAMGPHLDFIENDGLQVKILKEIPATNNNTFYQNIQGNFYEPDFDDFKNKLLEIYKNYDFYEDAALNYAPKIRNKFSWNSIIKKINYQLNAPPNPSDETLSKKIALTCTWVGEFPWWFNYHLLSCINNPEIDFYIFTDQEFKKTLPSNIKIITFAKEKLIYLIEKKSGYKINFKNNYKFSDLKSLHGKIYEEFLKSYDYWGFYDLDTIWGNIEKFIASDINNEIDILSIGGSEENGTHYRFSGPFTILKNTEEIRNLFSKIPTLPRIFSTNDITAWEEEDFYQYVKNKTSFKTKILLNSQNWKNNNYIFNSKWTPQKLTDEMGQEILVHHFYHKNTYFNKKQYGFDIKKQEELLFVTGGDEKYFDLINILAQSLAIFSKYKLIVYGINTPYPFDNQNVIKRQINLSYEKQENDGRFMAGFINKNFIALEALNENRAENYIWIDGDCFAGKNIDQLKNFVSSVSDYPQLNSHIHDTVFSNDSSNDGSWTDCHSNLQKLLKIENRKYPWRHSNLFLFNKKCEWFFGECIDIAKKIPEKDWHTYLRLHDETIFNVLFWKYDFEQILPVLDYEIERIESLKLLSEQNKLEDKVLDSTPHISPNLSQSAKLPQTKENIFFFHGKKDPIVAQNLLKEYLILENKLIDIEFNESENRIYIYPKISLDEKISILIFDIGNNLLMYEMKDVGFKNGISFWITPINNIKYKNLYGFKGFSIKLLKDNHIFFEKSLIINPNTPENNVYFNFDTNDRNIYWLSYHDFAYQRIYKDFLKVHPNDFVVDVGAGNGTFLKYLELFGVTNGLALEPSSAFNSLENNFKNNSSIKCLQCALYGKDGNFNLTEPKNSPTISTLYPQKAKIFDIENLFVNTNTKAIPCLTLSSLVEKQDIKFIDLLKIDIEGSEYGVFKTISPEFLSNHVDRILCEYHFNTDNEIQGILDKLHQANFNVHTIPQPRRDNAFGIIFAKNKKPTNKILTHRIENNGCNLFFSWNGSQNITVDIEIQDGFTGLQFYYDKITLTPEIEYFVSSGHNVKHKVFKITDFSGNILLNLNEYTGTDLNDFSKLKEKDYIKTINFHENDNSAAFVLYEMFIRKVYEHPNCFVKKDDIVLDIGANIGLFAAYSAFRDAKSIYCLEPNSYILDNLKKNTNLFSNINVFNKGVSKNTETKDLYFDKTKTACGSCFIDPKENETIACDFININEFIKENKIDHIDFLKIDCEGGEYEIIESLDNNYLSHKIKKIALEYHFNINNKLITLLEKLVSCGFEYDFAENSNEKIEQGTLFAWKRKEIINYHFIKGPFIEINGKEKNTYKVEFWDKDNKTLIFSDTIGNNCWSKCSHQYYINWQIRIYKNNKLFFLHDFDPTDKRIYIASDSPSIGDNIAWFPYILEFKKKYNCHVIYSGPFNDFFKKNYPEIEFIIPGLPAHNLYAMYSIGWWDWDKDNKNLSHLRPSNPRTKPLQKTCSDILGLEYKEIIPNLVLNDKQRYVNPKYVCISTFSTALAKFWQYPGGWQEIVDYLNTLGYKVIVVQKEPTVLKNVIDKTGNKPFDEVFNLIYHCEFFIGLASGLSWIAWGFKKPVIMIAGFTEEYTEFSTNCLRVINKNVCYGCWNDPSAYPFDKSFHWCPRNKDFECSKQIAPKMVKEKIDVLI